MPIEVSVDGLLHFFRSIESEAGILPTVLRSENVQVICQTSHQFAVVGMS